MRTLTRAVMTVMLAVGALAGAPAVVAGEAPAPVAGVTATPEGPAEGLAQDARGGDAVTDTGYVASTSSEPAQVVTGGLPARAADTGGPVGLVVLAAELVAGGLALVWLVRRNR